MNVHVHRCIQCSHTVATKSRTFVLACADIGCPGRVILAERRDNKLRRLEARRRGNKIERANADLLNSPLTKSKP